MTRMTRQIVFEALESERAYMEAKYAGTASSQRRGSRPDVQERTLDEWALYILEQAWQLAHLCGTTTDPEGKLHAVRKVGGLVVACMEEHGALFRSPQVVIDANLRQLNADLAEADDLMRYIPGGPGPIVLDRHSEVAFKLREASQGLDEAAPDVCEDCGRPPKQGHLALCGTALAELGAEAFRSRDQLETDGLLDPLSDETEDATLRPVVPDRHCSDDPGLDAAEADLDARLDAPKCGFEEAGPEISLEVTEAPPFCNFAIPGAPGLTCYLDSGHQGDCVAPAPEERLCGRNARVPCFPQDCDPECEGGFEPCALNAGHAGACSHDPFTHRCPNRRGYDGNRCDLERGHGGVCMGAGDALAAGPPEPEYQVAYMAPPMTLGAGWHWRFADRNGETDMWRYNKITQRPFMSEAEAEGAAKQAVASLGRPDRLEQERCQNTREFDGYPCTLERSHTGICSFGAFGSRQEQAAEEPTERCPRRDGTGTSQCILVAEHAGGCRTRPLPMPEAGKSALGDLLGKSATGDMLARCTGMAHKATQCGLDGGHEGRCHWPVAGRAAIMLKCRGRMGILGLPCGLDAGHEGPCLEFERMPKVCGGTVGGLAEPCCLPAGHDGPCIEQEGLERITTRRVQGGPL